MANHQDRGKAERAIFLADMFLAREKVRKENEAKGKEAKVKVRWVERDSDGCPISKRRSRSGETRKRASATGGNQRDLARAKNAKKQGDKGKKSDDGLSAAARKLRDAEIMQQKQKKAATPGGQPPKDDAAAGSSKE